MNELQQQLPEMLTGEELGNRLQVLPKYSDGDRDKSVSERLTLLNELYNIYVPSAMSNEIYTKLYLATLRSLGKKNTIEATQQYYQNYKAIKQQDHHGIIGGSDSFTIIGGAGIGKSSAIFRAISLISQNTIEMEQPYVKIVPCIVVQCPFDSSVKSLLLEILRKIDEAIDSNYHEKAIKARATTDMLIGSVSQACLNHVGLLIIDEIQNVANSKNGKNLIGSLTQLINNSGISICMVGTPDCKPFLEQTAYLARRSLGLEYGAMKYDKYFIDFCTTIWSYQYVHQKTELTPIILEWLYEHSGGNTSIIVALIHDAQEIAILNGSEMISIDNLNKAYQQRLSMLHDYIQPSIVHNSQTTKVRKSKPHKELAKTAPQKSDFKITDLASKTKSEGLDFLTLLKENVIVEEITI